MHGLFAAAAVADDDDDAYTIKHNEFDTTRDKDRARERLRSKK